MEIKKEYRYALLVPSSMGVRLTPAGSQPVGGGRMFGMTVTSAETNIASISSYLGLPVKVLTAFVEGSPVSDIIRENLRGRGMDFEGPVLPAGGPWGPRHQFNIADSGFGVRGPRVHNDRAGEAGRELSGESFDLERIFGTEGVAVVHMSGLFASLSPSTGRLCLAIARTAKKYGTIVSFDLNHRASFWKGREMELSALFHEIAMQSDILIGNEEDFQLCLGAEGPEPGGENVCAHIDCFAGMVRSLKQKYTGTQVFANTLREVIDAGRHMWGAVMLDGDEVHTVEPREISVLDRIGGGDGFVGGLLYAVLRGWEPTRRIGFAWACGALAVTFDTDYARPADEEMVWNAWRGNARVVR